MGRFSNSKAPMFAAGNPEAEALFVGKSFGRVFNDNNLTAFNVNIANRLDESGEEKPFGLNIVINGKEWTIPFSQSLPVDNLADEDYLGSCMFRSGFAYLRKEGEIVLNEKGEKMYDESRPYINLGKPGGLVISSVVQLLTPNEEEVTARAKQANPALAGVV